MACGGCKEIRRVSDMIDKSDNIDVKGGKKLLDMLSDILVLIVGSIIGLMVVIPYILYSLLFNKTVKIKTLKRKVDE